MPYHGKQAWLLAAMAAFGVVRNAEVPMRQPNDAPVSSSVSLSDLTTGKKPSINARKH